MFTDYTPALKSDLSLRWQTVQKHMQAIGADAILVNSNLNQLYLTGRIFMGYTYLPAQGLPHFFVRRPNNLVGDQVHHIYKPEQIPQFLTQIGLPAPQHLLLEAAELSHQNWLRLSKLWDTPSDDASTLLRRCRAVKTPYEVQIMKLTGARHAAVIEQYVARYHPGMSDQEWTVEMIHQMLQAGSLGIFRVAGEDMECFMGTVLAGPNGGAVSPYDFALGGRGLHPSLPVGQSGTKLEPGTPIMVDLAANFYGYLTDCTRTFAIGQLPEAAYAAHQTAIDITKALMAAGVPGAHCEELYHLALEMADQAGLGDYFMGLEQKARFVGHGTGLVINELPVLGARSRDHLALNMCIALEPKFVLPGIGAVGIEDTCLVTQQGMISLTPAPQAIITL